MMLHLSEEKHKLYQQIKNTNDPKKIAEIRAKLKEIWDQKKDKKFPFE